MGQFGLRHFALTEITVCEEGERREKTINGALKFCSFEKGELIRKSARKKEEVEKVWTCLCAHEEGG